MEAQGIEKERLLFSQDEDPDFIDQDNIKNPHLLGFFGRQDSQWAFLPVILHTFIIFIYSLIFLYGWLHIQIATDVDKSISSPYVGEYQPTFFQHRHSVFVGEPSEELDQAWKKLLTNINIRITQKELHNIPDRELQAIPLPDGEYYASPNVYHDLHCIKRLHHYMYQDHYFPNLTQEQKKANEVHNHHCLDMIRQSLMCQGDMQVLTMKWVPDEPMPTPNYTIPHKCVNWERLEAWAGERKLHNLFKPGYMVHPTLGPSYPNGHGDPIGESI